MKKFFMKIYIFEVPKIDFFEKREFIDIKHLRFVMIWSGSRCSRPFKIGLIWISKLKLAISASIKIDLFKNLSKTGYKILIYGLLSMGSILNNDCWVLKSLNRKYFVLGDLYTCKKIF